MKSKKKKKKDQSLPAFVFLYKYIQVEHHIIRTYFTAYNSCSGVFTNKAAVAAITLKTAIIASELPLMQPKVRTIIASLVLMEYCTGLKCILVQVAYKSRERE